MYGVAHVLPKAEEIVDEGLIEYYLKTTVDDAKVSESARGVRYGSGS